MTVLVDVGKILARFREDHGYRPGQVWDPYQGAYVWPRDLTRRPA